MQNSLVFQYLYITHRKICVLTHWSNLVTWYNFTGRMSDNILQFWDDISHFRKKCNYLNCNDSWQPHFGELPGNKGFGRQCSPEKNTKKSTEHAMNVVFPSWVFYLQKTYVENLSKGYKIKKSLSGVLVYRIIMSLTERWFSKYQLSSKLCFSTTCFFLFTNYSGHCLRCLLAAIRCIFYSDVFSDKKVKL